MNIFLQVASCFLALLAVALADDTVMTWNEFKAKYNKHYKNEEDEKFREKIYTERLKVITEHNEKYEAHIVTYSMGINEFSDLTDEELKSYTGFKQPLYTGGEIATFPADLSVPEVINWVEKGAVTPVKNQGSCRSAYAFSAIGAMEAQQFIKTGQLVALSEQNIIDCSDKYGNLGCFGGYIDSVFKYVIKNNGVNTEASYPNEQKNGTCRYNNANIGATFTSFKELPSGDESALQKAVGTIGPVAVGVDGNHFISYKSGIFSDPYCTAKNLDHSLLIVGYGIDNKTLHPYWLAKNSWGEDWGEKGYIRIVRNGNNECGIATAASFPVL